MYYIVLQVAGLLQIVLECDMADLDLKAHAIANELRIKKAQELEQRKQQNLLVRTPSELTKDLVDKIVSEVKKHKTNATIAATVNIHPNRLEEWIRRGAADVELKTAYGYLYMKMLVAKGELEETLVAKISDAKDWKAQVRLLEVLFPEQWAKVQEVRVKDKTDE